MQNNTANLNIMIKAARKASKSLIRDFNEIEKLQVVSKKAGDFVSKAELQLNRHDRFKEREGTYLIIIQP